MHAWTFLTSVLFWSYYRFGWISRKIIFRDNMECVFYRLDELSVDQATASYHLKELLAS